MTTITQTCTAPNCEMPVFAKGRCHGHYSQQYRALTKGSRPQLDYCAGECRQWRRIYANGMCFVCWRKR